MIWYGGGGGGVPNHRDTGALATRHHRESATGLLSYQVIRLRIRLENSWSQMTMCVQSNLSCLPLPAEVDCNVSVSMQAPSLILAREDSTSVGVSVCVVLVSGPPESTIVVNLAINGSTKAGWWSRLCYYCSITLVFPTKLSLQNHAH